MFGSLVSMQYVQFPENPGLEFEEAIRLFESRNVPPESSSAAPRERHVRRPCFNQHLAERVFLTL